MARPRTLCLAEPEAPPKKRCVRGHKIADVGYSLHRLRAKNGIVYTARRCKACLLDDVVACKRRKKR